MSPAHLHRSHVLINIDRSLKGFARTVRLFRSQVATLMPRSHCAELASRLAPTLKSALVGFNLLKSGRARNTSGCVGVGLDRSGRHSDKVLHVQLCRGPSPTFFNRGLSYIHTRRPTNPCSFPTIFYGLVGYDRGKKLPALIEKRIYPR